MERKIFMALGLHLCTINQLELILNITCYLELFLLLFILKRRGFFVHYMDYVMLLIGTSTVIHTLFRIDCVTFFSVLFYIQFVFLIICLLYKRQKNLDEKEKKSKND